MMRASGILLPISSIPSNYGIGCFSKEAYAFVDQLAEAGQKYWQILPHKDLEGSRKNFHKIVVCDLVNGNKQSLPTLFHFL